MIKFKKAKEFEKDWKIPGLYMENQLKKNNL